MKKFLSILLVLLCLVGCDSLSKKSVDIDQHYLSVIDAIKQHEVFSDSSNYFDITTEMAKIDGGYRFYVTIDNPRVAMYDIEAVAIENDVDYRSNMAANIGIFEDTVYCMVPNQKNTEKGYVTGMVVSGVSEHSATTLYVYVSFKNEDYSEVYSDYLKFDVSYQAE